jgi:uncharacterized membrane protein
MEVWISYVLLGGVLLAAAIIGFGLALLIFGQSQAAEPTTVTALIEQESHATSPRAILDGAVAGRPSSLVRLGVLVLILTPVTRVAMTLVLFLAQRDRAFVALTSVVLVVLILGLLGVGT